MPDALTYILVIAFTTFLVRALPFLFIRRPITNPRLKQFLDFVPFATLAAMAFPDMVFSTGNLLSGLLGFLSAVLVALKGGGLITVAGAASLAVLIAELIL
ncbi:MAG: AzlD domain-containing protein [Bacillota bacterium]|nr:AzlD domain-containing protein [Bacillota bacterium]